MSLNDGVKKNDYNYVNKAIQLIKFDGPNFILNEEAMDFLKSIKDEIIVISIVGKARTGKSFLMNTLLDLNGKSDGVRIYFKQFEVDSSINSCTKGIWIWGNYKKKDGSNAKIIFIDSEGTSSVDRSTKTYDSKIFALVVLISSLFLYNTTSNIDEQGISELSLAAHISNSIVSDDKNSAISELAPKFIWLIRDFSLEKIHPDTGEEITSKEYLELCLNKKISGKNSNENNIIRENIIKYFHERDCLTLCRPVDSEEELKRLNRIPFSNLNTDFKTEILNLKNEIFKNSQPKKFQGKKLTGIGLFHFIQNIITKINEGAVPNINNAWENVVINDIDDYLVKSQNMFSNSIKEIQNEWKYEEVLDYLYEKKKESYFYFSEVKILNRDTFNYNSKYLNYFEEKLALLNEYIRTSSDKVLKNVLIAKERSDENEFRNNFKEISKMNNISDYHNLIDIEEKSCSKTKSALNGLSKLSIFINGYIDIISSAWNSISNNLK